MLLRPAELTDEEKPMVELLRRLSSEVARARELAVGFVEVIKERRADDLRGWLVEAQRCGVPELAAFANGLTSDLRPPSCAGGAGVWVE